jgi:hypothetical protein
VDTSRVGVDVVAQFHRAHLCKRVHGERRYR